MKINDIPHTLTRKECCSIGRLLLSKAAIGNRTDFKVELSPEEEALLSETAGEEAGSAIYNALNSAHGLAVKLRWTYLNRVFTSEVV